LISMLSIFLFICGEKIGSRDLRIILLNIMNILKFDTGKTVFFLREQM